MRRFTFSAAAALACAAASLAPAALAQADMPRDFAGLEGDPRLGAKVDRVCSVAINDFAVAGRDTLLVEAGRKGWFLVRTNRCDGLDTAPAIQLRQSGACLNRNDGIQPLDSPIPQFGRPLDPNHVRPRRGAQLPTCSVREIYEWSPDARETL